MALVRCARCGSTVSTDDKICNHCGYSPNFKCIMCRYATCGCDDVNESCDFSGEYCGDYEMACPAGIYEEYDYDD